MRGNAASSAQQQDREIYDRRIHERFVKQSRADVGDQVGDGGPAQKSGKPETIVEDLVKIYVAASAIMKAVPLPDMVCTGKSCRKETHAFPAEALQQLRELLCPAQHFLIIIRREPENKNGKGRKQRQAEEKTAQGEGHISLHGVHQKSLYPSPDRDPAAGRRIKKPVGCKQQYFFLAVLIPPHKTGTPEAQASQEKTSAYFCAETRFCFRSHRSAP